MDHQVIVDGIRLRVTDRGQGAPALIFLHYWGGSSRTWEPVIAALPAGYRCIAPDLRGWGASGAPADDAYALADFADDIAALVVSFGLHDYVLVGHSMGGKIAQSLATRRPPGLIGLVLVAPAPPGPLTMLPEAMAAMRTAYTSPETVCTVLDHVLTAKPLPGRLREQVVVDSLRGAPAAKAAWPDSTSQEDIRTALSAINVPVLVIGGESDRVDAVTTLETELLPRLAHARLRVLARTGHLSPLEASVEVATCIADFVAELKALTAAPNI